MPAPKQYCVLITYRGLTSIGHVGELEDAVRDAQNWRAGAKQRRRAAGFRIRVIPMPDAPNKMELACDEA